MLDCLQHGYARNLLVGCPAPGSLGLVLYMIPSRPLYAQVTYKPYMLAPGCPELSVGSYEGVS